MKKRFLTMVMAVLLAFAAITPAFAAGSVNDNEQKLLDQFNTTMGSVSWFSDYQSAYLAKATAALSDERIDLDATAYNEFSSVIDQIAGIVAGYSDLDTFKVEKGQYVVDLVNGVANKYDMNVTVNAKTLEATVTISGDKIADTSKTVKQTGFGLGQTAVVVLAAAAALSGAFFVARKSNVNA